MFSFLATSTPPTVFPLISCGSGTGDTVTLGCLARDFTPSSLTFTWNNKGTALTDFIQYPAEENGDSYIGVSQIQVSTQDWTDKTSWFQCAWTHPAGNGATNVTRPGKAFFFLFFCFFCFLRFSVKLLMYFIIVEQFLGFHMK